MLLRGPYFIKLRKWEEENIYEDKNIIAGVGLVLKGYFSIYEKKKTMPLQKLEKMYGIGGYR